MKAWLLLPMLLPLSAPAWAQEPAAGRALAATCASCHGSDGRARGAAMPPLAGLKADVMLARLGEYRAGTRPGTVMPQIARGYSEAQLRLVARYFEQVAP